MSSVDQEFIGQVEFASEILGDAEHTQMMIDNRNTLRTHLDALIKAGERLHALLDPCLKGCLACELLGAVTQHQDALDTAKAEGGE